MEGSKEQEQQLAQSGSCKLGGSAHKPWRKQNMVRGAGAKFVALLSRFLNRCKTKITLCTAAAGSLVKQSLPDLSSWVGSYFKSGILGLIRTTPHLLMSPTPP